MRHIFLSIALGLIIFFIWLAIYLGAFRSVEIGIETQGPYTTIYKEHRGAYHKIVPVIEEVEAWVREQKFDPCQKSFGHYLDDTNWVEEERLTSYGGCIIEGELPEELPDGYEVFEIPKQRFIVARFTGSPGIGPLKVYPRVYKFAASQKLNLQESVTEIYEIISEKEMHTTYLFRIDETESPAP